MLSAVRAAAARRSQLPFVRFESTRASANAGIVGGPRTEKDPAKNAPSQGKPSESAAGSSSDATSREVLRSEAAAEADAALTRHRAEGEVVAAGVVSGTPPEMARRPVRIYQQSQESTQSAKSTSHHWRIDWDNLPGGGRWENANMGWASSADYMQGTHVKFNSKGEAEIRWRKRDGRRAVSDQSCCQGWSE